MSEQANKHPVMPLFAPLYTVGSELANLNWLTVCYETDPELLGRLLPGPLKNGGRAEILVWIAEFVSATFTGPSGERQMPRYFQGGLAARASHQGEEVAYPLVSYITGLNHGFTGRELFGLPKKQAREVGLNVRDGRVSGFITTADDTRLVEVDGVAAGSEETEIAPDWFTRQRTVKLIPSAEGTGYDVKQLVAVPFGFIGVNGVRQADLELSLGASPADPIAELPVGELTYQRVGSTSMTVGYGTYCGEPTTLPVWGRP